MTNSIHLDGQFCALICSRQLSLWKHRLNNLQLIIQPYIYFCLIKPWLKVFEIPQLKTGFSRMIAIMNEFKG